MSGARGAQGGVSIRVGLQAEGVKEGLEAIGRAGAAVGDQVQQGATKTEQAGAALARSFARTQAVLDPATAAAERHARQLEVIARAEAAGLATTERANALREAAARVLDANSAAMSRAATANDNLARSGVSMGAAFGQAGFQVQDFATQVAMGQNAAVAFATQFAQFAGLFGTAGAVAGAVATVALIGAQFLATAEDSKALENAIKAQETLWKGATDAAKAHGDSLKAQSERIAELAAHYERASMAARRFEEARVLNAQRGLNVERDRQNDAVLGRVDDLISRSRGDTQVTLPDGNTVAMIEQGVRSLAPGLEELRLRLSEFRAEGIVTSEAIARLYEALTTLDGGSVQTNRSLRETAAALMAATPEMLRLAEAQQQGATQFLALRMAAGDSETKLREYANALGRVGVEALNAARSLAAMQRAAVDLPLDRMIADARRNEAVIRAFAQGGREAAQAVADRGDREVAVTRRATQAMEETIAAMRRRGATEEEVGEITRRGQAEFLAAAGRAYDAEQRRGQVLEKTRRDTGAAREAQRDLNDELRIYAILRRDAGTGLLSGSQGDDLAIRTIQAQFREQNRDRDRAQREAEREATRAAERQQREVDQFVAQYSRDLSKGTVDALFDGFEKGKGFGQSMADAFKRSLRSAASAALDAIVFRPIMQMGVNALGLGTPAGNLTSGLGSILGISGTSTAGPAQAAAMAAAAQNGGGALTQGGMLGSVSSIYRGITGGIGNSALFNASVPFSETGFLMGSTGLGSFLNTPIIASTIPEATTAALGAMNSFGPATQSAVTAAGGAPGMTIGSALGPAAAIGGGIYGVVSGLERGGVGGYTSAAGGALSAVTGGAMLGAQMGLLPALGALGPAGLIAGAVLAIAGSLLPGQLPSSRAQAAKVNLASGEMTYEGNSKNFSQANRDEAEKFVRSIADLETAIQGKVGYGIGWEARVGVESGRKEGDPGKLYLGIGGPEETFERNEAGAKQLADRAAELIWEKFRASAADAPNEDIRKIILGSPTAAAFDANLAWLEGTYRPLLAAANDAATASNAFGTALESLAKPWNDAIAKAKELGLATEALTVKRDKEIAQAYRNRDLQVQAIEYQLSARLGAGDPALLAQIELGQRSVTAAQEVEALRKTLLDLGLAAVDTEGPLARLRAAQEQEAARLARYGALTPEQFASAANSAGSALGQLGSYAAGLATGDANPGTVLDRLDAARRQFESVSAAALGGDAIGLQGLQGASESYRGLLRETYGGGAGYAAGFAQIADVIARVADRGPEAWTQDFARAETDRIVDPLLGIRTAIEGLRRDLSLVMARPAA